MNQQHSGNSLKILERIEPFLKLTRFLREGGIYIELLLITIWLESNLRLAVNRPHVLAINN